MSLRPDDRSSRSRSKSRHRDRSRSRSNVRAPSPPAAVAEPRYATQMQYPTASAGMEMPAMPGGFDDDLPLASPRESQPAHRPSYPTSSGSYTSSLPYPTSSPFPSYDAPYSPYEDSGITMGNYTDFPPHERPGYSRQQSDHAASPHDSGLAYGASPYPETGRHHSGSISSPYTQAPGGAYANTSHYQHTPPPSSTAPPAAAQYQTSRNGSYSGHQSYQYAAPPEKITYSAKPQASHTPPTYTKSPQQAEHPTGRRSISQSHGAQVVDITPGAKRSSLSASNLTPRLDRLSVSGNRPSLGGNLPPPSPLLEAYHGTYQSVSPMVAPMMLAHESDLSDMSDLEPLAPAKPKSSSKSHKRTSSSVKSEKRSSKQSHRSEKVEKEHTALTLASAATASAKERKRVTLYDADEDARALAAALSHSKPDTVVICEILPALSHDQMLGLRSEYKKHAKVSGRGINIAKHLKLKLSGNFGKAAYVCALGRWESEGYWANFWYQSHGSRRELLIESLMGRTNAEIRQIADSFKDKRYSDDLRRCMEKELKADKFRTAVLMVLEGRRQEETETFPAEYRAKDVETLNKCLRVKEGGESAMLEIIIRRSDAHLRECLMVYERMYGVNFAREALKKSNNLVGEVMAHILNGVINRPARDALLLRHAINDIASHNKDDDLRYELLISRLVRFHWDRMHLARVKREYEDKYKTALEDDIEDATKGDFRDFMVELCEGGR